MFKSLLKYTWRIIAFTLLTILSQVGGIVYLFHLLFTRLLQKKDRLIGKGSRIALFWTLFALNSFLITPTIAPFFGRVALPLVASQEVPVSPISYVICLFNRHYATPELKTEIIRLGKELQQTHPNTIITYFDTNFPFWDGFRLLPHASHNDGEKADISFYYLDKKSKKALYKTTPGYVGYGSIEAPKKGEENYTQRCLSQGYWWYNFVSYCPLRFGHKNMAFDIERTRTLAKLLHKSPHIGKIFVEPHLKARLGMNHSNKYRFQGCGSVRHDDHFHIQL